MKVHKPKTVDEAINDLQQFLECDLYSKFRPDKEINGEVWVRADQFDDINDYHKYMEEHFNLLREQIKSITSKK